MHAPGITQKGIDISNRNDCFHLEETSEHIENCFASCIPAVIVKPIVMDFKNPTLEAISYHPYMYIFCLAIVKLNILKMKVWISVEPLICFLTPATSFLLTSFLHVLNT